MAAMSDDRFDPAFEQRLAGGLTDLADEATQPFDPAQISRAAIGRAGARSRRPSAAIWLQSVVAVAVLAVALVAVGVAGGFIKLPNNDLHPNPSFVPFTPAPSGSPAPIASPSSHALPPTIVPATPSPIAVVTPPLTTPAPTPVPTPTSSLEPSPSSEPTPTPSPTIAPVHAVVSMAVGASHACALADDGRIFCWGYNDMGQLGDGTQEYRDSPTVPVVGIADATAIAAGIRFSCAVRSDGSVWCWGEDPGSDSSSAVPWQVPGIDDATDVTAGGAFACALRSGGGIACWGNGQAGQLGNGVFENNSGVPAAQAVVGIDNAVAVSAGWAHACALLADGTVQCWGANGDGANVYGSLGDGSSDVRRSTPAPVVGLDSAVAISAGGWTACAIRADGTVWCWGYGEQGDLGDGNGTNSSTPVQVTGIDDARLLAVGDFHGCVTRSDGSTWCWGDTAWGSDPPTLTPVEGHKSATLVPVQIATGGRQYMMFIDQRGRAWWWGFGTAQLPERWRVGP